MSAADSLPPVLPERRADLEVAEFDTEYVVFDPEHRLAHHLRGFEAAAFDACDGHTDTRAFIDEATDLGHDPGTIRNRLSLTLYEFGSMAILAGSTLATVQVTPPCIGCEQAPRRSWWRRSQ